MHSLFYILSVKSMWPSGRYLSVRHKRPRPLENFPLVADKQTEKIRALRMLYRESIIPQIGIVQLISLLLLIILRNQIFL
jgi:hypothetical protein